MLSSLRRCSYDDGENFLVILCHYFENYQGNDTALFDSEEQKIFFYKELEEILEPLREVNLTRLRRATFSTASLFSQVGMGAMQERW